MTDPDIPAAVQRLDDMDDDKFKHLILSNLDTTRGDRDLWRNLRHPFVAEKTAGCLEEIIEQDEEIIAARDLSTGHARARRARIAGARLQEVEAHAQRNLLAVSRG